MADVRRSFVLGERNLGILEQDLGALNRARLLNTIGAYHLNSGHVDLSPLTEPQLVQLIVAAVESRLLIRKLR